MNAVTEPRGKHEPAANEPANDTPEAGPDAPRRRGRLLRLFLLVVVVAVAGAVGTPWLLQRWSHISISDSRIAASLITVSSEVSGRVTAVPVASGENVEKGQLLARFDSEQAKLDLVTLNAEIAGVEARQDQLRAQQAMIREQSASKVKSGLAQIKAAEAAHTSSEATLEKAQASLDRVSNLAGRKVLSQQTLDDARTTLAIARQEELAKDAAIENARANLAATRSEEAQISVLDRQIESLRAQEAGLVASRQQRQNDLERREVHAEFSGVVDAVFIDPGEYAAPGTRLLIYHDPHNIWVDANVKETDFSRLRPGANVAVSVDAYPDADFEGKIVRVGSAATSQFALLPSPNPSGNFTKITQRLPIRVSIEQRDDLLKPGMMVELSIDAD